MACPTLRPEHALSWLDSVIRVAPLQLADSWKKQQVGPLNGRHFSYCITMLVRFNETCHKAHSYLSHSEQFKRMMETEPSHIPYS
jgi:hypothetical protein